MHNTEKDRITHLELWVKMPLWVRISWAHLLWGQPPTMHSKGIFEMYFKTICLHQNGWFTQSLQAWSIFFSITEWPTQLLVWCTIWIVLSRFYLLPHACSYNHKKLSYLFIIIFGGQLKYISTLVGLHLLNLSWGTSVLGWEGWWKGNWEYC